MEALARRTATVGPAARVVLAAVLGLAMAAAQPPLSAPVVLFVVLPPLLWLLEGTKGAPAGFGLGWATGTAYFAATLFWIVEPFQVDAEAHGWLAPFALAGMAGGLALFWAAAFGLARLLGRGGWRGAVALAALWTLAEFARSHVLTGFPWALVGYAWVGTPVIQTAALVGIHGLGFLTLVAALLPGAGLPRGGHVAGAAVSASLVALLWGGGAVRLAQPVPERAEPYIVRLVQPNAAQELKWRPDMQALFYERHLAMTAAEGEPDIVVWSESAVPFALEYAGDHLAEIAAAAWPAPVTLGIMRLERGAAGDRWYNSLAVLGEGGAVEAVYDKHHLVPFGEYVPMRETIRRTGGPAIEPLTRGGFAAGVGPRVLDPPGVPPFLPLVCYEAIFPQWMWAPEGRPEWIVQVTNDAWFGELSGPFQHFAQNRVRAIEQGLPLARAANTGISAMIDPFGQVTAALGLGEEGFVDAELPAPLPPTAYARMGDLPVMGAILLIFGLTVANFSGGKPVRRRA